MVYIAVSRSGRSYLIPVSSNSIASWTFPLHLIFCLAALQKVLFSTSDMYRRFMPWVNWTIVFASIWTFTVTVQIQKHKSKMNMDPPYFDNWTKLCSYLVYRWFPIEYTCIVMEQYYRKQLISIDTMRIEPCPLHDEQKRLCTLILPGLLTCLDSLLIYRSWRYTTKQRAPVHFHNGNGRSRRTVFTYSCHNPMVTSLSKGPICSPQRVCTLLYNHIYWSFTWWLHCRRTIRNSTQTTDYVWPPTLSVSGTYQTIVRKRVLPIVCTTSASRVFYTPSSPL
jgi:hypothetical protein